ncbi:Alkaline phytoceramidase (aPHC) [Melia azedarach]|uniref:Alkaline phytoceramidase (APHC) n=1 Tax=Melia azedarach TaxID=155640 RepID=A0ACC1XAJ6_MELAZ|nr:Alkaline phytoceramidase (aPHC) [Melia azedarach]
MVWILNQQILRGRKTRIWGGAFLCWLFLMLATPKVPLSPHGNLFADMRNFLGVPNTLNVITNFPFLIVGVIGFVLTLQGSFFKISFRGEVWGWALFYAGIAGVAFGSAYYHLKPDEDRVMWDTLPMMIAYASLFSTFLVERVGVKIGLSCLIALVSVAFLSMSYARIFNDFRLCMTFQLIPCLAIPVMVFFLPPKYTHSRFWIYAAGVHIIAKFEAIADRKIYHANHYIISGHSLEHLCSAIIPVLLTIMLLCRSTRFQRLGDCKERP